jgi:type II secretory pathway component GspD/PulD (secretin)
MHARHFVLSAALSIAGACSTLASAQPGPAPAQRPGAEAPEPPVPTPQFVAAASPAEPLPTVELAALVERVAAAERKRFLIDSRATPRVYAGGVREQDVDYVALLGILRANGLAAVEIDGIVNVVPVFDVRSYAVPIVERDDDSIADDEWVTRVITTASTESPQLVPILRPLVSMQGHLAGFQPNKLVIVDRYANVKRITELVRALDR